MKLRLPTSQYLPGIRLCGALFTAVLLFSHCTQESAPDKKTPQAKRYQASDPILFLSTQFNPLEEANSVRDILAEGFDGEVDFQPNDNSYIFRKLQSSQKTSEHVLVGALHGDIQTLYRSQVLAPVNDVLSGLSDRGFSAEFLKLSQQDDGQYYYVPWMQASYVMAANKKALPYLPEGADLNRLSYAQLQQWAENIVRETGTAKLGLPVGTKGLMHRFFQGYLLPAFTGGVVTRFNSPEAVAMWQYMQQLWSVTNNKSLSFTTMAEPLLVEDVWIAWDHTARLLPAFEERPDDFVAFPAPAGPYGRSFMAVLSGLAIPKASEASPSVVEVIKFMTDPKIQTQLVRETGFFPTVSGVQLEQLPDALKKLAEAVVQQSAAADAKAALLPSGLGEQNSYFNELFTLTFSDVVLAKLPIETVLEKRQKELQQLFRMTGAACWQPDPESHEYCLEN